MKYSLIHLNPNTDYNLYCYGFPKNANQQNEVRQPLLTARTDVGKWNEMN